MIIEKTFFFTEELEEMRKLNLTEDEARERVEKLSIGHLGDEFKIPKLLSDSYAEWVNYGLQCRVNMFENFKSLRFKFSKNLILQFIDDSDSEIYSYAHLGTDLISYSKFRSKNIEMKLPKSIRDITDDQILMLKMAY